MKDDSLSPIIHDGPPPDPESYPILNAIIGPFGDKPTPEVGDHFRHHGSVFVIFETGDMVEGKMPIFAVRVRRAII